MTAEPMPLAMLDATLDKQSLKPLQIVYAVLGFGMAAATAVVFLSVWKPAPVTPPAGANETVFQLTVATGVLTAVSLFASFFLRKILLERLRRRESPPNTTDVVAALRAASIAYLAPMEGAGFFGLAICFLAGRFGLLATEGLYWWNMAPAMLMLYAVVNSFPKKANVLRLYERGVLKSA